MIYYRTTVRSEILFLFTLLFLSSCTSDNDYYQNVPVSSILEARILELYDSKDELILPSETDYSNIPSDPK